MSFNYNHITLVGRVTGKPEIKMLGESLKCNFKLAVDRQFRRDDGSTETDFINISIWNKLAELADKFLDKGMPILVEGRLQVREYEVDGDRRWLTEVVASNFQMLSTKKNNDQ